MYEIGQELEDAELVEELLGETFLVGEDYFIGEEIGAMRRPTRRRMPIRRAPMRRPVYQAQRPPAAQAALQAALAARRAKQGVIIKDEPPTKGRLVPMGINSAVAVVAGAAGTAVGNPQKLFRPERFVVPGTIAPSFTLASLLIGVDNQLVSTGAIPCEALTEQSVGAGLRLDTAQLNTTITANVNNIGAANLFFRAAIFGSMAT